MLSAYLPLVTAVYLVIQAALIDTGNTRSALLFKAVPGLLALLLAAPYVGKLL